MAQYHGRSLNIAEPGFLGSTSFSSVYQENQSLQTLHPEHSGKAVPAVGKIEQFHFLNRDSKTRNGAACLSLLRDWPTFDILVRKWHSRADLSMIAPWVVACQSSVKTEVYDHLGTSDDEMEQQLLRCSAHIFDNTLRPLTLQRGWTVDQYADQFTAGNIRWETVGMFYTAVGLATMVAEDISAAPDSAEKRYFLARQMLEASDTCISFCEEFQHVTDPEMWLICENLHMCTLVAGDASYLTWRRLGGLISACVAKGLHYEIEVSADVPFWMSELRKRLFAATYIFDKTISNFLGRPPRLPRKYCTMQLPLDLEPHHLRLPEAELEDIVNSLDQHGWNTQGSLGGMVWIRCYLITSMICEDVLELALAALPEDDGSLGQNIIRRSQDAWNSLPSFIRDISAFPRKNPFEQYISDSIMLGFRYNEFLLQRAIVKRAQTNNRELISVSREVFSIALNIVSHNTTGKYACDMPWIITQFALPVAGVLGLELLQQSHHSKGNEPIFPRSEVIQGLSNLVATMKWAIPKQDGNFEFCFQARHVLQRVLDIVLDPDMADIKIGSNTNEFSDDGNSTSSGSWLEQMASEPDFWSSLPNHPLLAVARK